MARSRNIKPSFFDNDELAEIDPLGRLLFIGLWTIADYKGEFVWREKRIKAKLLPYDECDIKKLAIDLDKSGFIRFYSNGNEVYCSVINFCSHQNPHKNERAKGSDIPEYSDSYRQLVDLNELTIIRDKSGFNQYDSHSDPADSLNLIPLTPIPDSRFPIHPTDKKSAGGEVSCETLPLDNMSPEAKQRSVEIQTAQNRHAYIEYCFNSFWALYPRKVSKKPAFKAWNKICKSLKTLEAVNDFTARVIQDVTNRTKLQQFGFDKLHPSTYLNQERWQDELVDDREREEVDWLSKHLDRTWADNLNVPEVNISSLTAEIDTNWRDNIDGCTTLDN